MNDVERKQKDCERARARWAAMTPDERAAYNARKRDRYATDVEYKARKKRQAKRYVDNNYDKVLAKRRTERGINGATGEQRGGECEICLRTFPVLDLDHDKLTGQVRGWLCRCCNLGLGKFGDDLATLERAVAYKRKSLDRSAVTK